MKLVNRSQFIASVASNTAICREHFRLVLSLPDFPATSPGQFIQIACRDAALHEREESCEEREWSPGMRFERCGSELFAPEAFLRRPFSLAGRRDANSGVELDIIHRVVGVGTDWMSRLKAGDEVNILGPLGNVFTSPKDDETALLVGGGVGIPPMLYLAEALAGRKAVAFSGATTRDLLPLWVDNRNQAEEFSRYGIRSVIATDDGTLGVKELVTEALVKYLDTNEGPAVIYTCGPEPMMKRVAEIALTRGIECQIAVERAMACGMGTCQSCCIRVKHGEDWRYKLACTDGPVFQASELLW